MDDLERHPFNPFLPADAVVLMLGSFPPQRKRWSMDFFYPNMQNDMWRIFGLIFFGDKDHFILNEKKAFDKEKIVELLLNKGIALYDTASAVRRLQDNASDKFLEVAEATDIKALLSKLPLCHAVVTTGQKATDTLRQQISVDEPAVGCHSTFTLEGKEYSLYRMPSSSRAYPLKLEKKAEAYRRMFEELGIKCHGIFSGIPEVTSLCADGNIDKETRRR